MLQDTWLYINTHWDLIGKLSLQHLQIIAIGNGIGVVVGVTVGILISGQGRESIADIVLYLSEIMMTIPSMALFGLLMPILAGLALPSIGYLPAIIALVAYGLLPILRNTYTGLGEVDPAMIEAGRGMGMSNRQILFKVKLPLAVPVIMAGLRNAIVLNIGIAAIAVVIGAGGLGVPIFRGIRNFRPDLILTGAIFVSILAVAVDTLLGQVEKWITPKGVKIGREE
ncbi:choline ABC transporter permease [Candidatus Aerophobetes bacterium]|mgnify:CR=1 FL=1|uniref:Choline ABC transporter permease n=1 Tax=Aerophobetes bacterium TaxID=2030807 RepID=A0A662DJM1_UNCAE|nr:MAG: choline ABC transporter permease [Candidatus Aerophobetes bacterium]